MNNYQILSFQEELDLRCSDYKVRLKHVDRLWDYLLKLTPELKIYEIENIRHVTKTIGFSHIGFSKLDYLLHISRVAAWAGLINKVNSVESVKVGLFHNIYETTNLNPSEVSDLIGQELESVVSCLKVNRKKQNDHAYLKEYYKTISLLPKKLGLIKVLDKLDNLYSLELTANPEVKVNYIQEVRKYVVPLCQRVAPEILRILDDTIEHVERCYL